MSKKERAEDYVPTHGEHIRQGLVPDVRLFLVMFPLIFWGTWELVGKNIEKGYRIKSATVTVSTQE